MSTPQARTALPRRVIRAARAVAEAVFSGPGGPPPAARLDWLMREFDDFLSRAGRGAVAVRLSLFVVSVVAPLFVARLLPLRALSLPMRVRALTRMEHSAVAAPVLAVKAMLCILYYEHPDAAREVGFVGSGMGLAPASGLVRRRAAP